MLKRITSNLTLVNTYSVQTPCFALFSALLVTRKSVERWAQIVYNTGIGRKGDTFQTDKPEQHLRR